MNDKPVSNGEKVFIGFILVLFYWIAGIITIGVLGDVFGVLPDTNGMPIEEFIGSTLLWPFFFIKYLSIGIWAVLSSGFSLLFKG